MVNEKYINKDINSLFVKLTNLIRMVRNDVASGTNKEYPLIADVHNTALNIPDDILEKIGKITVDEIKINLFDFKKQPYEYIRMMKKYFYDEIKKIESLKTESDKSLDKLIFDNGLDESQFNKIEIYRGIISDKILYRYQEFGQVEPILSYEDGKLVLQLGKEKSKYDLKSTEKLFEEKE
jgi:hypothetical protein